ncbi:MAG: class I SAM-dependent methyltransferase [Nostoc sp. ChiQUE02]|uniref:class I SAM-dependent methyltransferase n=1 Tax=Nostoc sp. ChiQUE02 TaxID=3075377 RepID=UPI002AD59E5C|nr:methyltransferase domain-containing protein [Nostoc sp. ChiQUE02]MDZ8233030.1 methyltransferase domain-containing protein [Nostoc sp. ChiQUE02]
MYQKLLKSIARHTLPVSIRSKLKAQLQGTEYCLPVGAVNFGNLRRLKPISEAWGFDRGLPIDRYYIENFLGSHCDDIKGRVLEIGDSFYTNKFGGDRVTKNDVFHAVEGNPEATFVGDLTSADHIPSDTFDCLILTETLQLIYEVRLALKTIYRILKPGGVVLVTVPGITQLSDQEWKNSWYWNYTTLSAQRLFQEVFPAANIQVKTYGNVLTATAFLQGLASQELRKEELDYRDSNYEVTITVRAVKPQVTS